MRGPIVETRWGRLEGTREQGLCVFRGIPYAEPPRGPRRWLPPAPPRAWAGVRPSRSFGPAAPQLPGFTARLLGADVTSCSEDCLTLNVWTPGCDGGRRPVLVWIHGGGFTSGAGGWPVYAGAQLARRGDAVVVTLSYRLGALGFLSLPGAPDAEGAANFGLLDQLAALAWVREHAAAFGGDPRRLTAFGNSAGAMSLGALLTAPRARGLFDRAILQSGAACHVSPPDVAERVATAFAAELGADAKDTAALRAAPLEAVLEAQARTAQKLRGVVRELPYQPVVDGVLLPRLPMDALRAGEGAAVPLLVGTNADEWRFYGLTDAASRELDEAALLRRCRRNLPGVDACGRERAERVVEVYRRARAERGEAADPPALWFAIETDRWFRVPATRLLEHHRGPGWAYAFAWRSPQLGEAVGACHALEVPFVFGTLEGELGRRLAGEDGRARVLSERMMDAWLAFAAAGVPRAPGLPEWPRYRPPLRATLRFDSECRLEEAPAEAERAVWDALE